MRKNTPGTEDKPLTIKDKRKLKLDWDQRPDWICPNCGYHMKSCVCKFQKEYARQKEKGETSRMVE